MAPLLGIELERHHPTPELSPEAQRSRLLSVLVKYFLGSAKRQPLLLVLEDADNDPSTLEWVRMLIVSPHRHFSC